MHYYSLLKFVIDFNHLVAPRTKCPDHQHFKLLLQNVINGKGEGVIMQRKASHYVRGRSDYLFKFKVSIINDDNND